MVSRIGGSGGGEGEGRGEVEQGELSEDRAEPGKAAAALAEDAAESEFGNNSFVTRTV